MRLFICVFLMLFVAGCSIQSYQSVPAAVEWSGDVRLLATLPDKIQETSGLAEKDGLLWTINDSGDKPVLYGLNSMHQLVKQVNVYGARNIDWESLAQDSDTLYIADCGNNRGKRRVLQIYKVLWDDLNAVASGGKVKATVINISYANRPDKVNPKSHNLDCEALTVVNDELWLFTKNRGDQKTNLYRIDKNAAEQTLSPVAYYPVEGLVTAVDYDHKSKRLAILGYGKNVLFGQSFIWIVPVESMPVWEKAKRLKLHPYAQWESVYWQNEGGNGRLLLTSERSPLLDVAIGELLFPVRDDYE